MLQIPKADVQIPEQDPQEMGSIYFSLENQINLVQASQIPGNTIKMHSNEAFCLVSIFINEVYMNKLKLKYQTHINYLVIHKKYGYQSISQASTRETPQSKNEQEVHLFR